VEGEYPAGDIPSIGEQDAAIRLAHAFDTWRALDRQLEQLGPNSVTPEQMSSAWQALIQAHEEWSNSR
jgi:hypothetical protein